MIPCCSLAGAIQISFVENQNLLPSSKQCPKFERSLPKQTPRFFPSKNITCPRTGWNIAFSIAVSTEWICFASKCSLPWSRGPLCWWILRSILGGETANLQRMVWYGSATCRRLLIAPSEIEEIIFVKTGLAVGFFGSSNPTTAL